MLETEKTYTITSDREPTFEGGVTEEPRRGEKFTKRIKWDYELLW
jgi:hypothetical protein